MADIGVTTADPAETPIEDKAQLVAALEKGGKPAAAWRIGTEHEKFGYRHGDLRPLVYDGPQGVRAVLEGLEQFGWKPKYEDDNVIALVMNDQSVTLEPGGQLELSGAPLETLHQTCDEVHIHLDQVRRVAEDLGVGFVGLGFQPKWRLEDIPMMPKGRYGIMRRYMPTRGRLGLDMMFRSCTVQVNLDFGDEPDMVKKFRTALALQPIATALFANSPFTDGKPNGFLSYRNYVWSDTDPDRTGYLPWVFEDGMGFERYVDYALDVPMYFVQRDGVYLDAAGQSFRDFLAGELPALPGEKPTPADWENHITTLFPEVRLKTFLELRGADGGPWRRLCALPALWTGILYDGAALEAAWDLCKDWTAGERARLHQEVARRGLKAEFRGVTVVDIAAEAVAIAGEGLKRRNRLDSFGEHEGHFLDVLRSTLDSGQTPAEDLLQAFTARWDGSVDPIFEEYAY